MKLYDKLADKGGNAMVELAIAGMTFIVLGIGGVDFGRLYYDSIAVGGAAFASTQVRRLQRDHRRRLRRHGSSRFSRV
ncbi:MAG: TadE/TadG family type IV pilus assembly protein [Bryobacterales bacterium]